MNSKKNNLNSGFNSESASSDLLEALTNLHTEVREGLDLVELRKKLEETIKDLYVHRNQGKKGEIFPMTTGIFLENEGNKTIVFYAFTLNDEDKREDLNLQMISAIGKTYPNDSDNLFIDVAMKQKVPLYGEKSKEPEIHGNYRVHYFNCWRASKISNNSSENVFPDFPEILNVAIYEPCSNLSSNILFFENILFSVDQVWWPFSNKKILTTTIISLKGLGIANKSILSEYLPVLILDCSIGMIISQLFLSYALQKTSLRDLNPLIEEMLIKSWFKIIRSENTITKLSLIDDDEEFRKIFFNLLFNIPYPFVQASVLREFVKGILTNTKGELTEYVKQRLENLLDLGYPLLGALIEDNSVNNDLQSLYSYIADLLLEQAKQALENKEYEKLKSLMGNLGEFLVFRHKDILTFILGMSKKEGLTPEINQEILGILINAIRKEGIIVDQKFELWRALSEFIKNANKNQMPLFADSAATLLSQHNLRNTEKVIELIKDLGFHEERDMIYNQLEDLRHRLKDKAACKPRLIGVFSQKGGVGKSTVALMTASRLATLHNKKVCLVELDFGGPSFYNYSEVGKGPFVNNFFEEVKVESNIEDYYYKNYKNKLPTPIKNLSIWPASPYWEDQLPFTTPSAPYAEERNFEKYVLEMKMIPLLTLDYDVIIFDVPSEIKDISRTVGRIISDSGGVVFLVSSLYTPSYSPLIENYWRFFSNNRVTPVLVINRPQLLDLEILDSCRSLSDYILVQKPNISFQAFGMEIHSPGLLSAFLPDKLELISIKNSEEIERVSRNIDIEKVINVLNESDETNLDQHLKLIMEGKSL